MNTDNRQPQLSFVIPVYNREKLVLETLLSIQAQSRSDWECILVDDRSTDRTFDVLKNFCEKDSRFRLFFRPENQTKGASSCRNIGYQKATGRFVQFFDSDDLLSPDFLERHLPKLEENNDLDFLLLRFTKFSTDPSRNTPSAILPENMTIPEALAAFKVDQGTPCFIWRRSFLNQQPELWRTDLDFGEDRELGFRLASAGRGTFSAEPVGIFYRYGKKGLRGKRRSSKTELSNTFELYKSMKDICKKTGQSEETERFIAKYIWKGMRQSCRFGDFEFMEKFNALSEELDEFPKYRNRRIRMTDSPFLYVFLYRTEYILTGFFRFLVSLATFGQL